MMPVMVTPGAAHIMAASVAGSAAPDIMSALVGVVAPTKKMSTLVGAVPPTEKMPTRVDGRWGSQNRYCSENSKH